MICRRSQTVLGMLAATVLAASGCSGNAPMMTPSTFGQTAFRTPLIEPSRGIYVSANNGSGVGVVFAYPEYNRSNGKPLCYVRGFNFLWDIATDAAGDLLVPDALGGIFVYKGPHMCGLELGHIKGFSNQQAVDAAAVDAAHKEIAVAYHYGRFISYPGSIAVCTLAKGCTRTLTNPGVFEIFSVTMAKNGDCWADGWPWSSTKPNLVYYAHCKGKGQTATGFQNEYAGGLDVDDEGHLLAISSPSFTSSNRHRSKLFVYGGCNPACTLIGGPFVLSPRKKHGQAEFGHLSPSSDRFVVADNTYSQVEIYAYTGHGTGLRYLYSFNNGFNGGIPIGAAYNRTSPGN